MIYLVDVARCAYHRFAVEAETQDEAKAKAEKIAYSSDWSKFGADYRIDNVSEVTV